MTASVRAVSICLTLACMGLAHPVATWSQPDGTVALKYVGVSDSKLKEPIPGLEGSGDAEFLTSLVNFTALLPFLPSWSQIEGKPRTEFTADFLVQRRFLEETLVTMESDNLVALGARLGFIWRPSYTWTTLALAGTRLPVDDLEKAQPRDLTYQFAGLAFHRPRDNFAWGIGAAFAQFTGTSRLLPLVHLDWSSLSGKVQIEVLELAKFQPIVPRASIWYHSTPGEPTWSIGFTVELTGQEYHLTKFDGSPLDEQGNVIPGNPEVSLALATLLLGPEIRVHTGRLEIAFLGGLATARRFEFRLPESDEPLRIPGDDGSPVEADFKLEQAGFFMVNGAFRF